MIDIPTTLDELKKTLGMGSGHTIVINNITINDYSMHVTIDTLSVEEFPRLLYPWSDHDLKSQHYAERCRQRTWENDHDDHGYLS